MPGHNGLWPVPACSLQHNQYDSGSAWERLADIEAGNSKIAEFSTAYEQKAEVTDVALHGAATDPWENFAGVGCRLAVNLCLRPIPDTHY